MHINHGTCIELIHSSPRISISASIRNRVRSERLLYLLILVHLLSSYTPIVNTLSSRLTFRFFSARFLVSLIVCSKLHPRTSTTVQYCPIRHPFKLKLFGSDRALYTLITCPNHILFPSSPFRASYRPHRSRMSPRCTKLSARERHSRLASPTPRHVEPHHT